MSLGEKIRAQSISAWAVIDGTRVGIVDLSISYMLNAIPQGVLSIPVGKRADTGTTAEIHALEDKLQTKTAIQVYIKATSNADIPLNKVLNGTFKIFDGYTAGGIGYTVNHGRCQLTIGIVGKLADLNSSSIASSSLFANTPDNLFRPVKQLILEGTSVRSLEAFGIPVIERVRTKGMWGAIKALLLAMSKSDVRLQGLQSLATNNTDVVSGLELINEVSSGSKKTTKYGLQIDAAAALSPTLLLSRITQILISELFSAYRGQSAWDKIVSAANLFFFRIVPLVESAIAVPYQPQNSNIWRTIEADEYSEAELNTYAPRQMAGLLLLRSVLGTTFTSLASQEKAPLESIIGVSNAQLTSNKPVKGMVLVRNAPSWLDGEAGSSVMTQDTAGTAANIKGAIRKKGTSKKAGKNHRKTDKEILKALSNKVAQSWFYDEVFKFRTGVISGRLRLDIAPGSSIAIESPREANKKRILYGTVAQVTINIGRSNAVANTVFQLTHLRTELEKNQAVAKNPLYTGTWYGAELTK